MSKIWMLGFSNSLPGAWASNVVKSVLCLHPKWICFQDIRLHLLLQGPLRKVFWEHSYQIRLFVECNSACCFPSSGARGDSVTPLPHVITQLLECSPRKWNTAFWGDSNLWGECSNRKLKALQEQAHSWSFCWDCFDIFMEYLKNIEPKRATVHITNVVAEAFIWEFPRTTYLLYPISYFTQHLFMWNVYMFFK